MFRDEFNQFQGDPTEERKKVRDSVKTTAFTFVVLCAGIRLGIIYFLYFFNHLK